MSNEEMPDNDHRVIGKRMRLFSIDPSVGQGLVLWLPNGAIIRNELQSLMQEELTEGGYLPVYTPHIGNIELYKTSGHYPYYKDSQYPPITIMKPDGHKCSQCGASDEVDEQYVLKPMNCPHHCMIYKSSIRSYRELPLRFSEFGTVYRYEAVGSLNGLTRVRGLTQDDAHIFCMPDQVEHEIRDAMKLTMRILEILGLKQYRVQVSKRNLDGPDKEKYVGDPALWDQAEATLENVCKGMSMPFEEKRGEAAFYGPKIDFMVTDAGGRERQLGTIQLDYLLPKRFQLEYVGNDGNAHRPVMIHRAPFGSLERFMAILTEHFNGKFPTWLSPVHVRIANITESSMQAATDSVVALRAKGVRVDCDIMNGGNIKAKVKNFESMGFIPYLAVIGDREASNLTVSVRKRGGIDMGVMLLTDFASMVCTEIKNRKLEIQEPVPSGLSPKS